MIGAVTIQYKLNLSERIYLQIQGNPYLQDFVDLPSYRDEVPFTASLFVTMMSKWWLAKVAVTLLLS